MKGSNRVGWNSCVGYDVGTDLMPNWVFQPQCCEKYAML